MAPTMDELVRQLQEASGLSGEEPSTCALGGKPRAFERFLIAHKLDVRAAAAALRDTLRFRAEHSLDDSGAGSHARKMVLAKVAPHWPGGLVTSIAGGSGVYYFGYGPLRPRKLMRDISESELRTFYLHFVEGMLAHMNAANGRACPTERWAGPVEVHDLRGISLSTHFYPPGLAMLARVLSLGQRHVPDNLRKERGRGRGNELILHY
ncbi:hypothetical protein EMIHUDRAFT_439641 [Emiliania huxleyi CCMP1516]|uniref:CRAL/TRIO N-terminal domain-containing protein n=2 Tax=Emiliania huxleyi TaxID=2903 RepID=A0A0D3KXU7_EMIH1|nr:hypothetical protein EMIHUDRAFT_439641 [Emiliania huxleyi CCMP1516]EOD40582.1 hypothetical protein EMIHUDRAFT_439641 [Emiliania huxleyi CCMP1516]|eukprot:XP_005793011.1 hypothetical protein EMIHUDRAFT_439641 [Emiliania huxleyi CCMP1516]